jgi:hypothetical protein
MPARSSAVPLRILSGSTRSVGRIRWLGKTVFMSDFSGKEISDQKQSATITIRYGDRRRGVLIADAHIDDPILAEITKAGRPQARRGRPAKSAT